MTIRTATGTFLASSAGRATTITITTLACLAGGIFLYLRDPARSEGADTKSSATGAGAGEESATPGGPAADQGQPIAVTRDKAASIGIRTAPASRGNWPERLQVTGRLELNESRVAHVSSLVQGVIREVRVELGQAVEQGDVLAYIDSREVGEAKLKLVQGQLQLASAKRTSEWHDTIQKNTLALLEALGEGKSLEEIETAFRDRPVGAYRQQLVSALARRNHATADYDRIRQLGAESVIPKKEVIRAKAQHEEAEATYRALQEQIRFDARKQASDSQQKVKTAEAGVAISRSHLLILGYTEGDIDSMDPIAEGDRVAYYPVRSPIAGTVIAREARLSQYVDTETELMEIADLSTVWLRADVFEKDLGAVRGLEGQSVTFASASYAGQTFTASVFSLGDVVHDESRAARLLATVDNSQRMLKPGMFVEVELTPRHDAGVLQLPAAAIQRHDGATFVFASDGDGGFERRDVTLGRATAKVVEIRDGLAEGAAVVVHGGFALKSEMLSELMVEE